MAKGLFTTIFGRTDEGIFPDLFANEGTYSPTKRMDIRLGNYEFAQAEEDDDEEDDLPTQAPPTTPSSQKIDLPTAPGGPATGPNVFTQDKEGFPMWLVGVFFLGIALAYRQKKKSKSA